MPTQEEIINRLRFGAGRPGFPKPLAGALTGGYPDSIRQRIARARMGGAMLTPEEYAGHIAPPPPRQDAPYTPSTMYTEGGGGMQTPDIGHFLNSGGMGLPDVQAVQERRRAATSARKTARRELRQARKGPATIHTTKAGNVAAKKATYKAARKEARATRGTVRKAKRTFRKRAGT